MSRIFRRWDKAAAESQKARHVLRPPLVTRGVGAQVEFDVGEVVRMHHAMPADAQHSQPVEMFAPHEQQPRSFRAEQPLVAIGGEEVDSRKRDIQREHAQALNGVEEDQRPAIVCNSHQFVHVDTPASGVADPTDADHASPLVARGGEPVEVHRTAVHRDAPRFHSAAGQIHPRVQIGRELIRQRDDVVPRLPSKSFGHQTDAGGGVGDERDFARLGGDQVCGERADFFDASRPFGPKRVAVFRGLPKPVQNRLSLLIAKA